MRPWIQLCPALLLGGVLACDDAEPIAADAGVLDTAVASDPFAEMADESEGLVNTSADLEAVLEHDALPGACEAYDLDPRDRKKRLLCGKSMFFYESFGTAGVPRVFVDFLIDEFPEEIGDGFSRFGMVRDPNSSEGLPLGLAPGQPIGEIPTVAFTCASCHFAQLPDGRYAVGAPNHRYEYGKQLLTIVGVPGLLAPNYDANAHDPDAVALLEPYRTRLVADADLRGRLINQLIPLLALAADPSGTLSIEEEHYYATWPAGTQDFLIKPLPIDDGVHTISKISALWSIPRAEEERAAGMPQAMLGWTGTAVSLMSFLEGFVVFGDGALEEWKSSRLEPLADYIYSLRAPMGPPQDPSLVRAGATLFAEKGCLDCHQGPRGSGTRLFTYDEIGTDEAMKRWADPEADGTLCCGFELPPGDEVANRIKSPRLVGLWAMQAFLHNGSVRSLEDLFCASGPRGPTAEIAYGAQGHDFTCEDLSQADKNALVAFLRSH